MSSATAIQSTAVSNPPMDMENFAALFEESLARQETSLVLSYVFQGMSQDRLGPLEADLRTTAPGSTYSVFFARPGAQ